MKKWIFLLLLFPLTCVAQTYQYLGVEDGLSNRRVYCIQKDKIGYMWFLTHEGIDRYNGKEFKQYKLMDGDIEVNSLLNLNWLYIDQEGVLWEIGKKGKIFRYDELHDTFELVYKLPIENFRDLPAPISFAWLDENKQIWLCNEETIFLYNTATGQIGHIKNKIKEEDGYFDVSELDIIGTEEIFNKVDNQYKVICRGKYDTISEISNEQLYSFCREKKIELDDLIFQGKIKYIENGWDEQIYKLLNYTNEKERAVLLRGKWYRYNEEYVSLLNDSVDSIETVYNPKYDFSRSQKINFVKQLIETEQKN